MSALFKNTTIAGTPTWRAQDVFASLWHRAVSCGTYQDSAVHLSRTSDHVFNIVSMAWAVNVCIVTVSSFVLNVCSVDCDTAFTFFWSFIDHAVILEVSLAFFSQYFCDCSSQSSFTMVNVTDCTDVNMRFRTFKFFLLPLGLYPPSQKQITF